MIQDQRHLLRQAASWGPPAIESELPAGVLDIATCDRDLALDDLMRQRAHTRLQQVTRALNRIDHASYGICHLCQADIPFSRLLAQPDATLWVDCKAEREQRALLRTDLTILKGWELSCAHLTAPPLPSCPPLLSRSGTAPLPIEAEHVL